MVAGSGAVPASKVGSARSPASRGSLMLLVCVAGITWLVEKLGGGGSEASAMVWRDRLRELDVDAYAPQTTRSIARPRRHLFRPSSDRAPARSSGTSTTNRHQQQTCQQDHLVEAKPWASPSVADPGKAGGDVTA